MTVCGGFKDQLQSLMKTISTTRPWYIRCIKPNDKHVPDELDPVRTLQQLRYGGVLEAVRVSRAGYPCRVEHKDFVNKFNSLVNKSDMINLNIREKCQYIIDTAQLPERDCQVGLSKIFLRQDAYDKIEAKRWKRLKIAATICQRRFRGYKHRKVHKRRIATLYRAVIMIKMWIRMRKLKHIRKKAAFRTIVRFYTKNVKAFVKRAQAAVAIQCLARKILSINARDVKIAERIQAKEDLKLSNQIKRLKIELENARSVIQQMNSKRESVNNSISESEDMSDGNNGSRIVDKGSTTSNSDRVEVFSTKHFENDTRSSHNTMTDKIDPNLLAERDELILKNATLLEANNSLTLQLEKLSETNTTLSNSNEKLRKELLANSSSLLVEELESAVAAAKAATSQAKKISEINVQLRNELGASVAANTGLRLQLESGLSKATPKNPSRERVRSTSIESHARRYSPKQLKDENASIQDQLIKEDLLHANEFLAIANRDLMIKNENYGKYIIDLERAIGSGEVNLLLEDGTEIEPAQLAQENIMLKKRVEMQAKINTTLSIECEQLKKDYAISKKQLEAVRDIMTPRKKQ
jgi:myosin heavy subunit